MALRSVPKSLVFNLPSKSLKSMFATVYYLFLDIGKSGCMCLHDVMRDNLTFAHPQKIVVVNLKVADLKGVVMGVKTQLIGSLKIRRI